MKNDEDQWLLLELVEHGLEVRTLRELLRRGAREVGLVGAEHAGHVLLPHSQELLRRVVLVGLLWEGFLHEEALAAHN